MLEKGRRRRRRWGRAARAAPGVARSLSTAATQEARVGFHVGICTGSVLNQVKNSKIPPPPRRRPGPVPQGRLSASARTAWRPRRPFQHPPTTTVKTDGTRLLQTPRSPPDVSPTRAPPKRLSRRRSRKAPPPPLAQTRIERRSS